LSGGNGFVWNFFHFFHSFFFFFFELGAQGAETVEFLEGAAVLALGLGLVAQEQSPSVGLPGGAAEAFAEDEIAILDAGDFDVAIAGEFRGHLAGGDAFDGEEFLGVDGAVEIQGVLAELVDFVEVFEADDGKGVAGEAVFAGVEGGPHFTGGGTGAGGFLSVDAVSGGLFVGGHGGCLSIQR
jgi:hypothetical protein